MNIVFCINVIFSVKKTHLLSVLVILCVFVCLFLLFGQLNVNVLETLHIQIHEKGKLKYEKEKINGKFMWHGKENYMPIISWEYLSCFFSLLSLSLALSLVQFNPIYKRRIKTKCPWFKMRRPVWVYFDRVLKCVCVCGF